MNLNGTVWLVEMDWKKFEKDRKSLLFLIPPGLGFFENLRAGGRGGAGKPGVKKHAVSQKNFVHFT